MSDGPLNLAKSWRIDFHSIVGPPGNGPERRMTMSEASEFVNPLVWVQFRLLGGWRRLGWVCIVCIGGFFVAASALWRITGGGNFSAFCASALNVVAFLLTILLVIGGSNAVHRAVRKDQSTRMMESHRLSPITGVQALIGYLVGPAVQILFLYALGSVVGVYLSSVAKLPVASWIMAVAYLLIAAVMVWSLSIVHALSTVKGGNPILALILVSTMGGFMLVSTVPGLALVLGVNVWAFAFAQVTGVIGGGVPKDLFMTLAVEFVTTGLWCFAIVRKFRRPDRPPYEVGWGFFFLVIGLLTCAIGLMLRRQLSWGSNQADPGVVFIATFLLTLLIGLVPVYGAEFCRAHGRRNLSPPGMFERPAFVIAATTLMVVAAYVLSTYAWIRLELDFELAFPKLRVWITIGVVALLWFIGSAGVMRILQAARYRGVIMPMALWAFILWGVPPFIEQIRRFSLSLASDDPPAWSILIGFSPPGALMVAWSDLNLALWPGLVFQAVVAVGLSWLGVRMMRKRLQKMAWSATADVPDPADAA